LALAACQGQMVSKHEEPGRFPNLPVVPSIFRLAVNYIVFSHGPHVAQNSPTRNCETIGVITADLLVQSYYQCLRNYPRPKFRSTIVVRLQKATNSRLFPSPTQSCNTYISLTDTRLQETTNQNNTNTYKQNNTNPVDCYHCQVATLILSESTSPSSSG